MTGVMKQTTDGEIVRTPGAMIQVMVGEIQVKMKKVKKNGQSKMRMEEMLLS